VVLEGSRLEVVVGDVEVKGVTPNRRSNLGAGTRADTANLEVGIVVGGLTKSVCLWAKSGEGSSSVELCFELIDVVFSKLEEMVGTADGGGVSRGRVIDNRG